MIHFLNIFTRERGGRYLNDSGIAPLTSCTCFRDPQVQGGRVCSTATRRGRRGRLQERISASVGGVCTTQDPLSNLPSPVNRQQWIRCLDPDAATTEHLIERYTRLCEASCNFTCPGCHNAQYTQLPAFYQNACRDFANAVALTLRPSEKTRIPELRRVRTMYDESTPCACEEEDKDVISDEDIIECRNCRVMIVKVDGCSSVWCVCGFSMSWTDEQRTKKLNQRKLLPVDPFDTTTYNYWTSWHDNFKCAAGEDYWELRQSAILHSLNNPAQSSAKLCANLSGSGDSVS
ncbi:hypothetical protein GQ600_9519 [Phytophthora cactorum]|nr:hypothetical protein GQ600_9519 [Phytophthora cactorum]